VSPVMVWHLQLSLRAACPVLARIVGSPAAAPAPFSIPVTLEYRQEPGLPPEDTEC
jgi:hypothetical protein